MVDEDALLAALDSSQLSWAGLDVFKTEPLPTDHRSADHPRLIATTSHRRTVAFHVGP